MIKIYGYSDDLIEVEGDVSAEFGYPYEGGDGALVATSNGALLRVRLDNVWRVEVLSGAEHVSIQPCTEDDEDNYSDVATVNGDVKWVACGNDWAPASKP